LPFACRFAYNPPNCMPAFLAFSPLLDPRYWINPTPVPLGSSLVGSLFVFFAWFLLVAIVLVSVAAWLRKKDQLKAKILRRLSGASAWTAILGLLALFFAYEQIPVFGMRLWFLLVGVYLAYRLVRIVLYVVRQYPQEKAIADERALRERYMH
jgi:hypothetical protein